nr:ComEC/Rec2 family competence protein [Azospirillum sp. SYSU D00513]
MEPPGWAGPLLLALCLLPLWPVRRRLGMLAACLALLVLAAGFAAAQWRAQRVAAPMLERQAGPVAVTGRVVSVQRLPNATRAVLEDLSIERVAAGATPARVRLRLTGKAPPPRSGERIRLLAVLHPLQGPAEPGAFDFQRHAFFDRLGGVGYALRAHETLEVRPPGPWRSLSDGFDRARGVIAERVRAAIADPGEAAVTAALMNGEQVAIPQPVMEAFRDSGLAHLLSISGLHVGIAAGIVFFTVRALLALVPPLALRWPIKKIAAVFAILAAAAYTMLVGAPLPTLRALLMTGVVMAAILVERDPLSMRLVAFAALVTLLILPEGLLGPSFQMSFGAVVALIAAYELASPVLARWRQETGFLGRSVLYLGGIAFTSLVATLATTPFAMFHFQQIAFYGLLANMIAVPVTSLWVMPCSLLAYLLMPLGLEGPALAAMGWGVAVIIWTAELASSLPGAVLRVPAMPLAGLVAVTLGGVWLAIWTRPWRLLGAAAVLAGLLSPLATVRPDVLVSREGTLMAVRGADGGLALSGRVNRTAETWLERDGAAEPEGRWPEAGSGVGGRLACDALGCLYREAGQSVALLRDPSALPEDCAAADVVVSAEPARRCGAPVVIDLWRLRREGAHALYLSPEGVRVESVRDRRGDRPWTVP